MIIKELPRSLRKLETVDLQDTLGWLKETQSKLIGKFYPFLWQRDIDRVEGELRRRERIAYWKNRIQGAAL